MRRRLSFVLISVLALGAGFLSASPAHAGAITVTRFDDPAPGACDPGDCSLREGIMAANAAPGANTIALQAGTYQLSVAGTAEDGALDGDLDVANDALTITGQGSPGRVPLGRATAVGSPATIIDAGGTATGERAFDVFSELTLNGLTVQNSIETSATGRAGLYGEPGSTLTLNDVLVTGHVNNSAGGTAYGSGINSDGTLNLFDVWSTANTAPTQCCSGVFHFPQGGGGSLTARNVWVTDNTDSTGIAPAEECCSGFFTDSSGPRILEHVYSINNRSATNCCTGMFVAAGGSATTATLSDITILDNVSGGSCCAGLILENDVIATLTRANVSRNTAVSNCCAGIFSEGDLTASNLTVSGNRADMCCSGIVTASSPTSVNNGTVTQNVANADDAGGDDGSGLVHTSGALSVSNTISAGNTVGTGGMGPDCFGTVTSLGYNLIGSTADCTFTPTMGDILGVDPLLGPLADNGGFTMTHALLKGSPAIDAGGPNATPTDQRGVPRNPDIGAYELVRCGKVTVNRVGTEGDDTLTGTGGSDGFLAFGGKDVARGRGGKDAFCMGSGRDRASGQGGKDLLKGQGGKDKLRGGAGKDKLNGGAGRDVLNGQKGNDRCNGGAGNDRGRKCERERKVP